MAKNEDCAISPKARNLLELWIPSAVTRKLIRTSPKHLDGASLSEQLNLTSMTTLQLTIKTMASRRLPKTQKEIILLRVFIRHGPDSSRKNMS